MFNTLLPTLAAAGINTDRLPYPLSVGKFYRLPAMGKSSGDKSCFIKMLAHGVAIFGNWSTGEKGTLFANKPTDKDELARWHKEAKAAQAKAHREQVKAWNEAAIRARNIWFDYSIAPNHYHQYLQKNDLNLTDLNNIKMTLLSPSTHLRITKSKAYNLLQPMGQSNS